MRDFGSLTVKNPWLAGGLAGLFACFALRLPPFALFSGGLVALIGLQRGLGAGVGVTVIAATLTLGAWFGLGSRPGLAFPLAFALWPPLLVMTELLRRKDSQGRTLLVVGVILLAYVLATHLIIGDVVSFWHEWLKTAVAAVPGATVQGFEESDTIPLFNGFMAFLYGLSLILSLLLGRWLQSILFNPGAFAPEFCRLTLPKWLLPVAVALVWGAGNLDQTLMADLFMIALLLYLFQGLAVIQGVLAVRGASMGWSIPAYLFLVYFPPQMIAAMALLGAVDTFVQFRDQSKAE